MMYICPVHVKFTKVVLVYIAVPVLATVAVIGIVGVVVGVLYKQTLGKSAKVDA